jgi:putative ATP-dependent endonuclease of OLD family
MILHSIDVKNFRSILNEGMVFDSVTALVGANGTGKSSFLHALNLFYGKRTVRTVLTTAKIC